MHACIHACMHACIHSYIYIYIYIERERDTYTYIVRVDVARGADAAALAQDLYHITLYHIISDYII